MFILLPADQGLFEVHLFLHRNWAAGLPLHYALGYNRRCHQPRVKLLRRLEVYGRTLSGVGFLCLLLLLFDHFFEGFPLSGWRDLFGFFGGFVLISLKLLEGWVEEVDSLQDS